MFALLAAELTDSTNPEDQTDPKAKKLFETSSGLRKRIEQARKTRTNESGELEFKYSHEVERVKNVVVKNARAHALYELEYWTDESSHHVNMLTFQNLSLELYCHFEGITGFLIPSVSPEIGTRQFIRLGVDCSPFNVHYPEMHGSWVVVQDEIYRYLVEEVDDGVLVQSVIHENFITECLLFGGNL